MCSLKPKHKSATSARQTLAPNEQTRERAMATAHPIPNGNAIEACTYHIKVKCNKRYCIYAFYLISLRFLRSSTHRLSEQWHRLRRRCFDQIQVNIFLFSLWRLRLRWKRYGSNRRYWFCRKINLFSCTLARDSTTFHLWSLMCGT